MESDEQRRSHSFLCTDCSSTGGSFRAGRGEDGERFLNYITSLKLEIPDVRNLRILLYGPQGAGKSSFFNSVDTVLRGRISTRALGNSGAGRSFTIKSKTYKLRNPTLPFTFTDITGIHEGGTGIQPGDIMKLLKGHISDGYTFNPASTITEEDPRYKRNPELKDKIHCLVAVLPANTLSSIPDKVFRQMSEVRNKARDLDIPQVIIMTKVDETCELAEKDLRKVYTSKKIKQKMVECSNKLGVPVECIFPVKNYHEERATNTTADTLLLDALQHIVNFAKDHVEDQADEKDD
ncbi:hypothetical protein DNTS_030999 [Danionella cerebrum]|uniref:G domain-containing protein n=1 Tax=Danionella cerebrum TaxID=2873325 RepID=A0A553PV89_9TELE|nr:hypothetical protein DNTS_030999 [Danionella translucida]TRY81603.1 hypothetical protein DNTS_030999 [Danionella translucida]